MHEFLVAGQSGQQVDCHHAFSCAGSAFHDQDLLLFLCDGAVYELQGGFEDNFLIIDEGKLLISVEQSHHGIGQGFAGTDFAVFDHLHDVLRIAVFYKFSNKIGQQSHIALEENGRFVDMGLIEGQGEGGAVFAVVQEGARGELNLVFLYRAVEVGEEVGVGPGLVGGMGRFTISPTEFSYYHSIFFCGSYLAPLF